MRDGKNSETVSFISASANGISNSIHQDAPMAAPAAPQTSDVPAASDGSSAAADRHCGKLHPLRQRAIGIFPARAKNSGDAVSDFLAGGKHAEHNEIQKLTEMPGVAGFLFAAVLSLVTAHPLRADNAIQSQTINLNAGQTHVIDHLKIGSRPSIHVIENPHALVIHGETPGQLVLLGAERGQWEVTVTRDDGALVAYRIYVAAIADSATPLDAGTGPVAYSTQAFQNLSHLKALSKAAPKRTAFARGRCVRRRCPTAGCRAAD